MTRLHLNIDAAINEMRIFEEPFDVLLDGIGIPRQAIKGSNLVSGFRYNAADESRATIQGLKAVGESWDKRCKKDLQI